MREDLKRAAELLSAGDHTCVMRRSDSIFTDNRRGVRPLLELLKSGHNFHGY